MSDSDENERRGRRERRGDTADARRRRDRRMGDRRESPRIPVRILVRQVDLGGSFEERQGDLAVGGVYFEERHLPVGTEVEVRFKVPGQAKDVRCQGEILRISGKEGKYGAHVKFVELPTDAELAIARFIDDQELNK